MTYAEQIIAGDRIKHRWDGAAGTIVSVHATFVTVTWDFSPGHVFSADPALLLPLNDTVEVLAEPSRCDCGGCVAGDPCDAAPAGLLAPLTPAELRELDARMHAAQRVGGTVWPATWLGSGLNADVTYVRREVNAALAGKGLW